jgi:hypothetical protein
VHLSRLVASVALLTDDPETVFVLDVGTNDFDHADSNDEVVWEGSRDRVLVTEGSTTVSIRVRSRNARDTRILHRATTSDSTPVE